MVLSTSALAAIVSLLSYPEAGYYCRTSVIEYSLGNHPDRGISQLLPE